MKATADIVCSKAQGSALILTDIRPLIHEIRGVQVMFDRDLASLYQVPTKVLNQAVKRNANRFPSEYCFRLTDAEMEELVTNCDRFATLKHSSVPMSAFTEQGVAMLSAVLKSDVAIRESIRIMNAFVSMRKMISVMAPAFAKLEARVEANERRQIADQARNDQRFIELHEKMSGGDVQNEQIFYQGQFWEAKSLLIKFVRRAKKDLIVVDPYVGVATLDILAKRTRGVKIELITHSNGELAESDFEAFAKQYGHFTRTLSGTCHDRFIIVDQKEIFVIGASLKDAARLTFSATRIGPELIPGLLESLHKCAEESVEYGKPKSSK